MPRNTLCCADDAEEKANFSLEHSTVRPPAGGIWLWNHKADRKHEERSPKRL